MSNRKKWHFAIDRGGTFTDVIGIDPEGGLHYLKLLSQSPHYKDPAIEAIRRIIKKDPPFDSDTIGIIRIGTTLATNALLERKGAKVLLLITEGFKNLLEIGYQQRQQLFSLCVKKTDPLFQAVCEVPERISSDGRIVRMLDESLLKRRLNLFNPKDFDAVAVVLLHSWKNPEHELKTEAILKEFGFSEVYLSHRVNNEIKVVSRGNATLIDAYLGPVLKEYIKNLRKDMGKVNFEFFTSAGGTVKPEAFTGRKAILSGPAGGALAVASLAEMMGIEKVVGIDMGGTSTDVCRWANGLGMTYERQLTGLEINTEMIDIHTIASGGGSILWFDGDRMRVGPDSAGSDPGPACYGLGGPPTITDANLLTGRLVLQSLPKSFGPNRDAQASIEASRNALKELSTNIKRQTAIEYTPESLALGYLAIANEMMANAIKEITVSKGQDVREFTLLAFGGAAGQHACFIAESLKMRKVLFHPLAGLFSAVGIALARPVYTLSFTFLKPFTEDIMEEIEASFINAEHQMGIGADYIITRRVGLRVKGSEGEITVAFGRYHDMLKEFVGCHRALYGFFEPGSPIEITTLRLRAYRKQRLLEEPIPYRWDIKKSPEPVLWQKLYEKEEAVESPVFRWEELPVGFSMTGPVIVVNPFTTVVIPRSFKLNILDGGLLEATPVKYDKRSKVVSVDKSDPVMLELFHRAFTSIATEMGEVLQRTAKSVNIKERKDYSCAVFSAEGELVANAPHIPVHLGAMAETVKTIIQHNQHDMRPGDVYLSNNPYKGGSHLPDLTVVQPVFSEEGELLFFTASRGHHPDIGGKSPGSIPAECSHIEEEGVLIDNFIIMRNGHFREEALLEIFRAHPYPPRSPEEIIYDIIAQIGACRRGAQRLKELTEKFSYSVVKAYMQFIQDNGERAIKRAIMQLLQGKSYLENSFAEELDDGSLIVINISINAGDNPPDTVSMSINFTGTSEQHLTDNLNAPLAVVKAAILYVLRTLVDDDIPLNSGCLRAVDIIVPSGSLLNPSWPAPVGSGNVETSQRIVDIILGCLGLSAGSQGSMNNILFQVEGEAPYYETIGGGYGATEYCDGASAVQVHMTNTRITDPEILELRHPGVRLRRFMIRKNSGGKGTHTGGDGIIREFEFLKETELTIISERRRVPAFGINGGQPGKTGVNLLYKAGQKPQRLPHRVHLKISPGTRLIVKTPGGGGFGRS